MYYSDNNSLNFNSSIWGTDNSFFPRASEKTSKEAEDLTADISYLGKPSSEDINTNETRTENTENQGTGTSGNQSQELSGTMGSGGLGMYPANQGIPFNMTTSDTQGFNTSTNPLYGTYFMAQNSPSMGTLTEGISPTNPSAQSYIGASMHPSMYGWTHYCIPHMPAYPIPSFVNPALQGPMGTMGMGQMGSQFQSGASLQYPMVTYPNISSTGAYNLSGATAPQGPAMNINTMNTPGMSYPWVYPGTPPAGMNHMAIFPFPPYTGGLGPVIVQRDDLDDMDEQEDSTPDAMTRDSKHKHNKKMKKQKKQCFYYNAFSNYPYYSPVYFPMQHNGHEGCGCLWLQPFLLNLDMD